MGEQNFIFLSFIAIQIKIFRETKNLVYKIPYRRASKGILHTTKNLIKISCKNSKN